MYLLCLYLLWFYLPKLAPVNNIFDDILIGNFMKTKLINVPSLYPDFTPYVSKFSDNGYANTERELKKYYNAYNSRIHAATPSKESRAIFFGRTVKSTVYSFNPKEITAIIINSLFVYIVLKSSNRIENILGKNGIGIVRKVFGIILLAIAVKLFSTNINLIAG